MPKNQSPDKRDYVSNKPRAKKTRTSTLRQSLQNLTPKRKAQLIIATVLILVLIGLVVADLALHGPVYTLFSNKDQVVDFINSAGPAGPLLYILLQAFQTVVAPIPGNIVGGVGGFLFGWWGILWTEIGAAIGCFIVFYLSRRFGRPLVEKLVDKKSLDKFDFISGERAPFILFLIFLIPGLPDDVVCYVAGLTKVPIRQLMALVIIGRFPSVVVTNYIGAGLGEADMTPVIVAVVLTVILLAGIALKRNEIIEFLQKKSKSDTVDDTLEHLRFKDAEEEMKEISDHTPHLHHDDKE